MDLGKVDDWYNAGRLASKYVKIASSMVKPGAKLITIAEHIEEKILDDNAVPAWPVNLSLNTCAAHYTPVVNDETILTKEHIVKCDVGVAFNGAVGDNAITVDLTGKYDALVKASRDALNDAAKILQIGVSLGEIGAIIEETIVKAGFQPVRNLSGHGIDRYQVHTPPTIPNYANHATGVLKKGQIIAIEPFASTGIGKIKDAPDPNIFEVIDTKPIRDLTARQVLHELMQHDGLPYGKRWLCRKFPENKVDFALKRLHANGNIMNHAPLVEISSGIISQAEHTFLIDDDVVILTK